MLQRARAEEILGRRGGRWIRTPTRYLSFFSEALRLLHEKGWTQGALARSRRGYSLATGKDKHAASFCGLGALERATPEHKDYRVCKTLLGEALGASPSETISGINDHPDTEAARARIFGGYAQVIAVLREMA